MCVWRRSRAKFASATLEFLAKFSRVKIGARCAQHAIDLPIVRRVRRRTWGKLWLESAQRLALQNRALGAEFVQIFSFEKLRIGCKQLQCESVAFWVRAHFKRWALGPTLRPPLPPLQVGPGAMRAKKAAKSAANNYSKSTKFRQSLHEVCTKFVRSLREICAN